MNRGPTPFTNEGEGEPPVRGFIHEPEKPEKARGDAVLLTHGAGGDCRAPLLVALSEQLSAAGFTVLRFDLPFRQLRPHGPPSPASATRDQDGIRRAVTVMRTRCDGRLFLGGQSYGGRQITIAASAGSSLADALLLLSYPLHPPGQPGRLRTEHFSRLRVPSLFISGTRDPFGSEQELTSAFALIPARTAFMAVPEAGHSLLTKKNRGLLPAAIAERFVAFA